MKSEIDVKALLLEVFNLPDYIDASNCDVVRSITHNLSANSYSIEPVLSYSSDVYLLIFEKELQKFLIKIRAVDQLMKLDSEARAIKVLSKEMLVSDVVLYGVALGYEIIIYDYLESNVDIKSDHLNDELITSTWESILIVQNALYSSLDAISLSPDKIPKYADNVHRYTKKYVGQEIPLSILRPLDEYLNTPKFSDRMTVFSDRSPANWIFSRGGIVPIDFDLFFLEPCLADFVQFIDYHELGNSYDRNSLINKCLSFLSKKNIFYSEQDFHYHAIYRNLIMGAVYHCQNKMISLFHYERALSSAEFLNEVLLGGQIKKILNEVAWI